MEDRKIQSKKRYIWAFLIGTFVFVMVFGLTYAISYFEYQKVSQSGQELSYGIFKDKLDFSFFGKSICNSSSFQKISGDLRFQGTIIDDLENKFGKTDKNVLFRKQFYSLVELEHFEFVKQVNKECNKKIQTILFFYSNEKGDSSKSEDAGKLLDAVYSRNPEIMIYSFDINLDDDLIRELKSKYNVSSAPIILVNEKTRFDGTQNIDRIEQYLK